MVMDGTIFHSRRMRMTKKERVAEETLQIRIMRWALAAFWLGMFTGMAITVGVQYIQ